MKGCLVLNKYYSDEGQAYTESRLTDCFRERGVPLIKARYYDSAGIGGFDFSETDFAVFWDKDINLAKFLERNGVRVYNSSAAVEVCDDKQKTYGRLASAGVPLIPTFFSALAYETDGLKEDGLLLAAVQKEFGFPLVVKENVGSQGRQVYLAGDVSELRMLHKRLFAKPHQYQKFIGKPGEDMRVYTVEGNAVAAVKRKNPGFFISNAASGGKTEPATLSPELKSLAEKIAGMLGLDYGAVDFLEQEGQYFFLEANSNAYFKGAEALGFDIAGKIADHILKTEKAAANERKH